MNTVNIEELKGILRTNRCLISFTKKDGEQREMECTLDPALVPVFEKKTTRVKKENTEVLAVWDLNKKEFRSFRINLLNSYKILD